MPLHTRPILLGKLQIDSMNNKIDWKETDLTTSYDLSTTVSVMTEYGHTILDAIVSAMTSKSTASGLGITYSWSFETNGKVTIEADSNMFYLKLTTSETSKILTGGDGFVGSQGSESFGFTIQSAYPAYNTSFQGDDQIAHSFFPNYPPATDSGNQYEFTTATGRTIGGQTTTYLFSETNFSALENVSKKTLGFRRMNEEAYNSYIKYFLPYALQGNPNGIFAYIEDSTVLSSYEERYLFENSLTAFTPTRTNDLVSWSFDITSIPKV